MEFYGEFGDDQEALEQHVEEMFDFRGDLSVYTEEAADEKCRENILENLWAFRPEFLSCYTDISKQSLKKIQEALCEDANEVFLEIFEDSLDKIVDDAIASDGRGHFLSSYDFEENECKFNGKWYYIYRN